MLVPRLQMAMKDAAVAMRFVELDIHKVKLAVSNAAFCDDLVGELSHRFDEPP